MKRRSVIACGAPATCDVGAQLLKDGGTAVDAAVGAAFAAFVAEPVLTGPFGGGFATVGGCGKHVTYDFFADVPGRGLGAAKDQKELDFRGLDVSFGAAMQTFHIGRGAVAAPLLSPGLLRLHEKHGRLPIATVMAPAIALARNGVAMSPGVSPFFEILDPILNATKQSAALFAPSGKVLRTGEIFKSPDLATLFEEIARTGRAAGTESLLKHFGAPTGRLTQEDLDAGKIIERQPLAVPCGKYEVLLNPPPSSGGLLVAFGLRLLDRVDRSVWQDETATYQHLLAAMAITSLIRSEELDRAIDDGNPNFDGVADRILADSFIDDWHEDFLRVAHEGPSKTVPPSNPLGGTTHISVIDSDGLACSITSSNGEGCGHVVPGAGVLANNFMGEDDLHPRGFFTHPVGTRLTSMMCPAIVTVDGEPDLVLGTGGSNRIRTAILQVLTHHLLGGRSIEDAVAAPRMHYEGDCLYLEREGYGTRLSTATAEAISNVVHDSVIFEKPHMYFGGVHAAGAGGHGAGDPRRAGAVWVEERG